MVSARQTARSTTNRYVHDVNRSLPFVLDDRARKHVWGNGLACVVDTSGTVDVFHTDGLGSVRAIADAADSVVQTWQS